MNHCMVYECGNEPKPGVALHELPSSRLAPNDGVASFAEQGVIEMGHKNLMVCSKYFLVSNSKIWASTDWICPIKHGEIF